jgi:diguanylate cyclase (GGDEF)-like protein
MNMRTPSWQKILLVCFVITVVAVIVPVLVVNSLLWDVALEDKLPDLIVSAIIPFFIVAPISVFGVYVAKTLLETVQRLDQLVRIDPMTGLLSRTQFMAQAEEFRKPGGFLVLADADKFKNINDTLGHAAGDEALKHMATVMQRVFSPHGKVARMGGEEFGVHLPDISREQAELLMAAVGTRLRNEGFQYFEHQIKPTLSIGVVPTVGDIPVACLLNRADEALYEAKRRGRDQYVFLEPLDDKAGVAA